MDALPALKQMLWLLTAAFCLLQSPLAWSIWEDNQLPQLDYRTMPPTIYVYPTTVHYSSRIAAPTAVPTPFVASKIETVVEPQIFFLVPTASQCTVSPTVTVASSIPVATASPVASPTEITLHSSTSLDIITSLASYSPSPFVIEIDLNQILLVLFCGLLSRCFSGLFGYPALEIEKVSTVEAVEVPFDSSKIEVIVRKPTFEEYKERHAASIDPERPITIVALIFEYFTYCRQLQAFIDQAAARSASPQLVVVQAQGPARTVAMTFPVIARAEPQTFQKNLQKTVAPVARMVSMGVNTDPQEDLQKTVAPVARMVSMGINTVSREIVEKTTKSSPIPLKIAPLPTPAVPHPQTAQIALLAKPAWTKRAILPRPPRIPVPKIKMFNEAVQTSPPASVSMETSTDDLPRDNQSISTQTAAPPTPPTYRQMETQTTVVDTLAPIFVYTPLPYCAGQSHLRWDFIRNIAGYRQRVVSSVEDITDGISRLKISDQEDVVGLVESEGSISTSTTGNNSLTSTASTPSTPATTPASSPVKLDFLFGDSTNVAAPQSMWESSSAAPPSPATFVFGDPSNSSSTTLPAALAPVEESLEEFVYDGEDSGFVESSAGVMSLDELYSYGRKLSKREAADATVSSSSPQESSESRVMSLDDLFVKGQQLSEKLHSGASIFIEGLSVPTKPTPTRKIRSLKSQRPSFPLPSRPHPSLCLNLSPLPLLPPVLPSCPASLEPAPLETPLPSLLPLEPAPAPAVETLRPQAQTDWSPAVDLLDSLALLGWQSDLSSPFKRPTILQLPSKSTPFVGLSPSPPTAAELSIPPPSKPQVPTPAIRRPRKLVKSRPLTRAQRS